MANLKTNIINGIQNGLGFIFIVSIFIFGFYLVKGRNGLQATDGDTLGASQWNQLVTKVEILETQVGELSPLICPSGFIKVENQGFSLGCIQESTNPTATVYNAMKFCSSQFGGRLPEFNELYVAKEYNGIPKGLRERVSGGTYGGSAHVGFVINTTEVPTYDSVATSNIYRCFLPR